MVALIFCNVLFSNIYLGNHLWFYPSVRFVSTKRGTISPGVLYSSLNKGADNRFYVKKKKKNTSPHRIHKSITNKYLHKPPSELRVIDIPNQSFEIPNMQPLIRRLQTYICKIAKYNSL